MEDDRYTDPADDVHRLDEALKQIRLIRDRLDDDALADYLQEAAIIIEDVQGELSSHRDDD